MNEKVFEFQHSHEYKPISPEDILTNLEICLQEYGKPDCLKRLKKDVLDNKIREYSYKIPHHLLHEDITFSLEGLNRIPLESFRVSSLQDVIDLENILSRKLYYPEYSDKEYDLILKKGYNRKVAKIPLFYPERFDDKNLLSKLYYKLYCTKLPYSIPLSTLTPEMVRNYVAMILSKYYNYTISKRLDAYYTEKLKPIHDECALTYNHYEKYGLDSHYFTQVVTRWGHATDDFGGYSYPIYTYFLSRKIMNQFAEQIKKVYDSPWPTTKELRKYES